MTAEETLIDAAAKAGYEAMVAAYFARHALSGFTRSTWEEQQETTKTDWRATVRAIQAVIEPHMHCNSCDGSAPECQPNYTVRDGRRVHPLDGSE